MAGRYGRGVVTVAAVVLAAMAAPVLCAEAQDPAAAWPVSGQNIHNTRNAPDERQVGPSDVSRLTPRWVLTTDGNVTTTPAVVDGIVYVPDYGGSLWAVEAATGKVVWKHKINQYSGIPGDVSRTTPAYWEGQLITGQGVQTAHNRTGAFMLSIDAHTGVLRWRTQVEKDPEAIITASPVVDDGVVYLGTA
ncbi:MAG TPA: PQQ-binding-like beta-propeller repeat protein, partial [Acetobacteraceae bacterium]|nr:PQQ-binding-like beta-propeller repeat protein [Acetobacteraceae bacterium]